MNIKSIIIRLAVDADMRTKMRLQFPKILDGYFLTSNGEVLNREEVKQLDTQKFFLDGLSFISLRV